MHINLAIVDNHSLFRKVLRNYLMDQTGIRIVADVPGFPDLIDQLNLTDCDVALMDILHPGETEAGAIRNLRRHAPGLKLILLSACRDLDIISGLLDHGVQACISKADDPEELVRAIRTVAEGSIYPNQLFTDALYHSRQHLVETTVTKEPVVLSDREKKIIQLLWDEKSNKEIAGDLFLGLRSIEKIKKEIKGKLGQKSTIGILKYAISRRIIGEQASAIPILNSAGCNG